MPSEDNTARARRFVLEHNQEGYRATFDELLAPMCMVHEYLPGVAPAMDRAAFTQFIAMFRAAMPDIQNAVEDVIAEGDKVTVRWTGQGTHTGAGLMGIPAAGKQVRANGIYIFHFQGGKIVEIWNLWDTLNVLQQLGALPAPDQAPAGV